MSETRERARGMTLREQAERERTAADAMALLDRLARRYVGADRAADVAADTWLSLATADAGTARARVLADLASEQNRGRGVRVAQAAVRTVAYNARRAELVAEGATVGDVEHLPRGTVESALAADGYSERADRDESGRRILSADRFAAAMASADATVRAATGDAAMAAVRPPRRAYRVDEITRPNAVQIRREQSLETLLSQGFRVHADRSHDDQSADRYGRARQWRYLLTADAPVVAGKVATAVRAAVAASGRPFGALLADHYATTTERSQGSRKRPHACQSTRAVRALCDDDESAVLARTSEHGRIAWSDLLRELELPTTRQYLRVVQAMAAALATDSQRPTVRFAGADRAAATRAAVARAAYAAAAVAADR